MGIRVLYVPTEEGEFRQVGLRRPLGDLLRAGLIEAASVYSLRSRMEREDPESVRAGLVARIADFRPELVLMQHLGGTGLEDHHFAAMRRAGDFTLVYHEGDPYTRLLHPLPGPAKAAGRAADVVFTTGSGVFAENFRRLGAQDVRWAPSAFDAERFPIEPVDRRETRPYDVVVVANRNRPRLRGHPNWRDRIAFVTALQERFGERVAVYGAGWSGSSARGPVDFAHQTQAIRSGWISANWDHYAREPKYFSNRLAISLSVGSVHATVRHPGYDDVFPPSTAEFLLLESERGALIDRIESTLASTTPARLVAASEAAQRFAWSRLRQDDQVLDFLNAKEPLVPPDAAKASWDLAAAPLDEV